MSALFWTLILLQFSCVTTVARYVVGKENKPVVIQTLNLYHPNGLGIENDWVMRRERLACVDANLRHHRPDFFLAQQMLSSGNSPSDSDELILQAGALAGYEAEKIEIPIEDQDADRVAFLTAVALPTKIVSQRFQGLNTTMKIIENVYSSATVAEFGSGPVLLIQVDRMDLAGTIDTNLFYRNLSSRIQSLQQMTGICEERTVVAGYFPPSSDMSSLESLDLIDVARDVCDESPRCDTLSKTNELRQSLGIFIEDQRMDRIFVHSSSSVLHSHMVFQTAYPITSYAQEKGVKSLFSSIRYGWSADVLFRKCSVR